MARVAFEIVAVYDLENIVPCDDDADEIRLRLEVIRDFQVPNDPLAVRVWRKESYSIRPSFQRKEDDPYDSLADEIILVRDLFLEQVLENIRGTDPLTVLEYALREISRAFGEQPDQGA